MTELGGSGLGPRLPETSEWHQRAPGVRVRRLRSRQRTHRRRRLSAMGLLLAMLAAGLLALIPRVTGNVRETGAEGSAPAPVQQTWLLIGTVEADPSRGADWLSMMSWDPDVPRALMVYLPRSTVAEIPGHGLDSLGRAMVYGGEPLQVATAANLLGVRFDHYLRISDKVLGVLLDKVGGVDLDVERPLTRVDDDGRAVVAFEEGRQGLSGRQAAEYLSFVDPEADEISRGARHGQLWAALLSSIRKRGPSELGTLFSTSQDLVSTDASTKSLDRFFSGFTSPAPSKMFFEIMPVTSTENAPGSTQYAANPEALEALVGRYLARSRLVGAQERGRRIEILNGNGVPSMGDEVAQRLVPRGFRLVRSQNAESFDYDVTQIVVYPGSRDASARAAEVRKALGVGEVLMSIREQPLVDITIVIGHDFVRAMSGAGPDPGVHLAP